MKKQKWKLFICILIIVSIFSSCTLNLKNLNKGNLSQNLSEEDSLDLQENKKQEIGSNINTGITLEGPNSYDSADTALLVSKNKEENTVTFLNLDLGRQYTLTVEGTTTLYDKYGGAVSLDQIQEGDIVDITFLKSKKRLNSMQLSAKSWVYENIDHYEIDTVRQNITIGSDIFKLSKDTLYLSEGRLVESMDLNASDVITVKGLDSQVLSINIEKGHGYLRLTNDENFIGGWIEIGQSQIQQITEDMLLTVPEGSYQILISHNGGGGTKEVIINRNEEVTLDIGDLEVAQEQYGTVVFSLSPSNLTLYIDGTQADPSGPVTLEYGIHQIIAKADGYKSITSYLKVGQPSAGIDIILDAIESSTEESKETESTKNTESTSTESGSSETNSDTVTSYYKVYIDAPEGAEVYLDGNYVGISPCNFRKAAGTHIITLRKSGYETRSYTVQVDAEEKDISYSFADLVVSSSTSTEVPSSTTVPSSTAE